MTFPIAFDHLQAGKKVRRRNWAPSMHLSMLKNGHVIIHFIDGKSGLWVYTKAELKGSDWEDYGDE